MSGDRVTRQYDLRVSFMATSEQAKGLQETLEAAAAVFFAPTEENARVLFEMGANAVVLVAEMGRA